MIHIKNSESVLAELIPTELMNELLHGKDGKEHRTLGYCRCGGGLYGQRNFDFIRPAITLKAQIRHTHIAAKGAPVGYDRSWVAPEDVRIATLGIGFADGYSRSNSNAGAYGKGAHLGVGAAGHLCELA